MENDAEFDRRKLAALTEDAHAELMTTFWAIGKRVMTLASEWGCDPQQKLTVTRAMVAALKAAASAIGDLRLPEELNAVCAACGGRVRCVRYLDDRCSRGTGEPNGQG